VKRIKRYYPELDWLRVSLILAVFLHHVFMPFNGDGWHIMNNESSKLLDDIMVYFEQVRLQTLFFVAGAASFILLSKVSAIEFIANKFHRLFIPFMVGMVVVVPPQTYFEHVEQYDSIFSAYGQLIFNFETNHLWFIEFLLVFMLLGIPFYWGMCCSIGRRFSQAIIQLAESRNGLFVIVIFLVLIRGLAQFMTSSDGHKVENLSISLFFLFFFLAGMLFIGSQKIWQAIILHRRANLYWLAFSSCAFYAYYYSPDLSPYLSLTVRWQLWWLVCSLVSWSAVLTLIGYAGCYCASTPTWLKNMNTLIYPFYIIHQTVIVILGFYIVQYSAGILIKSISLLFLSLIICSVVCFFVVRPFNVTRYLFGLKRIDKSTLMGAAR